MSIQLRKTRLQNNGLLYHVPDECPHCGVKMIPVSNTLNSLPYVNSSNVKGSLSFLSHVCIDPICNKSYVTTHFVKDTDDTEFISIYPNIKQVRFDQSLHELSPLFVTVYNQAYEAEQSYNYELAGAGYRIALEYLVKDYLIKYKNDGSNIIKMKLHDCISKNFTLDEDLFVSAEMVRYLGNDHVHYETRYSEVDFFNIKMYLDYFANTITLKLKIKNPVVPLKV